ncbi:hypothetical protein BH10ACT1_BH10ACT1_30890 [soil metagenome]
MTGGRKVTIVHLGTSSSMGGLRRVASLTAIFEAAGAVVSTIPLRTEQRVALGDALQPGIGAVLAGHTVPETLAWSRTGTLQQLRRLDPDVVICCTARAYHPDLTAGRWHMVLDYVDKLSDSYRDRSLILGRTPRSLLFRLLATTAGRAERHPLPAGATGIAAGWADAASLGLGWVPITIALPHVDDLHAPDHDVLFLGKLSYPPNVEAIERLGRIWPRVLRARPDTTLLLAGAAPTPAVLALARRSGWTVMADFEDLGVVAASARIAAAPLRYSSGIQIKALEAAAHGLPQVVSSAVARGFGPGMPILVADHDDEVISALVGLLDDPDERRRLSQAGRAHVADQYSVERWVPWAAAILERPADGSH